MGKRLIDAHQHVWDIGRRELYGWLTPAMGGLYRSFTVGEYAALVEGLGVCHSVLVQASPTERETELMLEAAVGSQGLVAGVVGWIDAKREDLEVRWREMLEMGGDLLVGVRPMLQDLEDERYVLSAEMARLAGVLIASNKTFDALVHPRHLPHLIQFVKANKGLRVVIDHAAKPSLSIAKGGVLDPLWCESMKTLAESGLYVKMSGLLTQIIDSDASQSLEEKKQCLTECIRFVLATFTSTHVIWGSDWPVLILSGESISGWLDLCESVFSSLGLSSSDKEDIYFHNAIKFYNLKLK